MTTDDAFLAAIDARPGDRTARLVYADWLDDHDHPDRAELIRVEEEMDRLPAFADRFWALKPRRNELRAAAPADWLARLGYGTVCRPVFGHGWPDGWRDRWRLIREFTERWHGVPMPDVGGRPAEVAEVERQLGRGLPPSVREWVAFQYDGRSPDSPPQLFPGQWGLEEITTRPGDLLLTDGRGVFAVAAEHLDRPDPPVRLHHLFTGESDCPEYEDEAALTDHAVERATSVSGDAGRFETPVANRGDAVRRLTAGLDTAVSFGSSHLFEVGDLLATLRPVYFERHQASLYVACRRPIPLANVQEVVLEFVRSAQWAAGLFAPLAPRGGSPF